MPIRSTDLEKARIISQIAHCNPFTPERIQLERRLLGRAFAKEDADWNVRGTLGRMPENVHRMHGATEELLVRLRKQSDFNDEEWQIYRDVALVALYHRFSGPFETYLMESESRERAPRKPAFYGDFAADFAELFFAPQIRPPHEKDAAHYFACFFQIRRAFHEIYKRLHGRSAPAARLRAEIWHSIFTHDMRRYQRLLYARMNSHVTLITGPSGTGKELVARSIAHSCFIPFHEPTGAFTADFRTAFLPVNLSALTPTLIESELFGHKRGSFTGAVSDRAGWFEICKPLDTVFLDELGEVSVPIQVKLLRTLESRTFERLGETATRPFQGKLIGATNRDLAAAMKDGTFREDFYYRLCGDLIRTPSLREQLADAPGELENLATFLARRHTGDEGEARHLAHEVSTWAREHLPEDYAWPGNIRELDQCIRNILIRNTYQPQSGQHTGGAASWPDEWNQGAYTAEQVLALYTARVFARAGSLDETARRMNLDRRTVRKYLQAHANGKAPESANTGR